MCACAYLRTRANVCSVDLSSILLSASSRRVSFDTFLSAGRRYVLPPLELSLYGSRVFDIDTHYRPNFDRNSSPLKRDECGLMGSAQLPRLETGERRI
jgi:hypothetical protein